MTGKALVLIATKSAGVGIDKNDVHFVIEADMPNSIEEFFQEGGRAGRDLSASEVILYYWHENKAVHLKHIGEIENSVVRESSMNRLHSILRYANTNKCHIQFIEEYFGKSQTAPCKWCDNCLFTPIVERVIITSDAINLLRVCLLVGNIVKKPSPGLIDKIYIGSKGREVTKHKLDELSLHGLGKSQSVSAAENLILLLITRKFFKEIAKSRNESQYSDTYLEVTVAGSEVLEGTQFRLNE